jgi:hypothetical protein
VKNIDATIKWFVAMGLVLASYSLVLAGIYFGSKHVGEGVFDLLVSVMWMGFVYLLARYAVSQLQRDSQLEHLERLGELAKLASELHEKVESKSEEDTHEEHLEHTFQKIWDEIVGEDRAPTIDETERMRRMFHNVTGHYVRLTSHSDHLDISFSDTPFPHSEAKKKPATPREAGYKATHIPVRTPKTAGKKPLNKVK